MALKSIVLCDSCGIEKKEVNHWFVIESNEERFSSWPFNPDLLEERSDEIKDVCGANCATQLFQKWLTSKGGHIYNELGDNQNVSS